MAAPVLGNRNCFFVNYVGTDDAGYNAIGAPWSYLTLEAALTALASVANPPSATNPWIIAIGPGVFSLPLGFVLPPWVWITGCADGESGSPTVLDLGGNITLQSTWAANTTARGGLANLILRTASGTPVVDFTMPVPSAGNPARTVELQNITADCDLTFQATGTGDVVQMDNVVQNGTLADTITIISGTAQINQLQTIADVAMSSGATLALSARITASQIPIIAVTKGVAACAVAFDAVSWPLRGSVTLTNTPTLTRLSDANADGYSPTTPADWPVVPTTVQEALDELAGGGAAAGPNGAAAVTNNSGNTTITPTQKNWVQYMTMTGAAGTRVLILDTTGATLGQRIKVFVTRADGGGIVTEMRNATAGGTLLATMPTGAGVTTGIFEFVYGTIAGGFAADAWVPIDYQIPATT